MPVDNVEVREAAARLQAVTGWFIDDRVIADRFLTPRLTPDQVHVIADRFEQTTEALDAIGLVRDHLDRAFRAANVIKARYHIDQARNVLAPVGHGHAFAGQHPGDDTIHDGAVVADELVGDDRAVYD